MAINRERVYYAARSTTTFEKRLIIFNTRLLYRAPTGLTPRARENGEIDNVPVHSVSISMPESPLIRCRSAQKTRH